MKPREARAQAALGPGESLRCPGYALDQILPCREQDVHSIVVDRGHGFPPSRAFRFENGFGGTLTFELPTSAIVASLLGPLDRAQ